MRRVVLLLPVLMACTSLGSEPRLPTGTPVAEPLPAVIMDSLWAMDQQCSGITTADSWRRIQWLAVAADSFRYAPGQWAYGFWVARHTVYLADMLRDPRFPVADDSMRFRLVIRHEMLHDLTQSGEHGAAFAQCYL